MVLDLERSWADFGVAKQVEDQRALEVGDSDGLGVAFANEGLHGSPGFLNRGIAGLDVVLAVEGPSGWVADGGINVFECNWEVDDEEIKIINVPISKLLLGNLLDLIAVMEAVPELADQE